MSIDSTSTPDEPDLRGGLLSKTFVGFLVTQFLGALNDNMFRWLVVPIAKNKFGDLDYVALGAGLACFVLPYLMLIYPSGYLADRFSKRNVIVACKVAEIVIMLLGIAAIFFGNIYLMFVLVALMGAQSAIFSPSKMGSIPEMLRVDRITAANGLMGLTTILAAAIGCVLGNLLYWATRPDGQKGLWISALAVVGTALVGWLSSLLITRLPAANPNRAFSRNWIHGAWTDLRLLSSHRVLLRVALGIAFFMVVASLAQMNIDKYGISELDLKQKDIGWLMIPLIFGIGLGCVLAIVWSGGRIELGIVPLGAVGIAISSMLLFTSTDSFAWSCVWLIGLGVGGGLFNVPLMAFQQHRSPKSSRGAILAASNFLSFSGMLLVSVLFPVLYGVFRLDAAGVFLVAGLGTIPVALYVFFLLPGATLRFVVWLASHTVYRLRVHGRENLPEEGGALLVANHVSMADGVFLLISSSRPIRMIARADPYMERWPLSWLNRVMGVIPIDPKKGPKSLVRSLKIAKQAIAGGELVCIFAEGHITRTGRLQPFRPGLMRIVEGTGAPVIPVYLDELWGSIFSYQGGKLYWKWPRRWPYPVSILFGRPIDDPENVHQVHQAVGELGALAVNKRKDLRMTLPRVFLRQCRKSLFRSKLTDSTSEPLSGGGLLVKSLVLCRILEQKMLTSEEEMVGVLLPPSVGAVLANTALPLLRRVPVNLNYTLSADVLGSCIAQCKIKHVLTSRKLMERLKLKLDAEAVYIEDLIEKVTWHDKLIAGCQTYLLPAFLLERLLGLRRVSNDDLLTVIFTSGSTGQPKGVMLSHHNVASNIESIEQIIHLKKSDVVLGVLPFFHSYGFTVTLWTVLTLEPMGVYHHNPLDSRRIGELCAKYGGTILMATPTFLRSYLRRCQPEQLASLEIVFAGAEKLPIELTNDFEEKFGVRPREAYGSTELSPLATMNAPDHVAADIEQKETKEGTVGPPVPRVSAKVVDLETGADLGIDWPGMLLIKGPNVMKGYLGQPELTAEVIRDGWYVTGDIAVIDSDGFITITGRESRFSKIGGEMVPHIKIEETLTKILGEESEEIAAVVTAVPDPKKGERLIIVHKPLEKTPEEICKELSGAGLPNLWIPSTDSFLPVDRIPILGTGKIDMKKVKEMAMEKFGG